MRLIGLTINCLLCLFFINKINAQTNIITVTDSLFQHPESVVFDAKRNSLYISNLNKNTPMDSLKTDFISSIAINGTITDLEFITDLSSPTGLVIYNDTLYAVERNGIAVVDLDQKKIIRRIPIYSTGFLNDITIDTSTGIFYISETNKDGRIYRVVNGVSEIWIEDTLLAETNGLLVDGDKLIAGVNGDGFLKSIDLNNKSIQNLAFLGEGNIDGIQKMDDSYLVSHFLGNLYIVNKNINTQEILNTRTSAIFIADFCFIASQNLLVIPSLRTNQIYFYHYEN